MTRLGELVRLEKDSVRALQQELEETKQSWGASESEANTALAASHSYEVLPLYTKLHGCFQRILDSLRVIRKPH